MYTNLKESQPAHTGATAVTRSPRQGTSGAPVLPCLHSACILWIRRHGEKATHPLVTAISGEEHCKSSKTWDDCARGERKYTQGKTTYSLGSIIFS